MPDGGESTRQPKPEHEGRPHSGRLLNYLGEQCRRTKVQHFRIGRPKLKPRHRLRACPNPKISTGCEQALGQGSLEITPLDRFTRNFLAPVRTPAGGCRLF
jgi:hypothetical protein